jgi:hypothetical protein
VRSFKEQPKKIDFLNTFPPEAKKTQLIKALPITPLMVQENVELTKAAEPTYPKFSYLPNFTLH